MFIAKKFDICEILSKNFNIYIKIFFRDAGIFIWHQAELVLRHQMLVSNYFVKFFYSVLSVFNCYLSLELVSGTDNCYLASGPIVRYWQMLSSLWVYSAVWYWACLSSVSPCHLSHLVICLTLSSVSPCHLSHPVTYLTLSSVSPCRLSHPVICLTLSSVSPSHLSHPVICLTLSSVSPCHLAHSVIWLTCRLSHPVICLTLSSVSPCHLSHLSSDSPVVCLTSNLTWSVICTYFYLYHLSSVSPVICPPP